jgi:hypothetical protein
MSKAEFFAFVLPAVKHIRSIVVTRCDDLASTMPAEVWGREQRCLF